MLRGKIKRDSTVVTTLTLDHAASGTAAMVTTYGEAGGHATSQAVVVAPAGTNATTASVRGKGLFRIIVDMKDDRDTGTLVVQENGVTMDQGNITGDTTWVYTVQ